MTQSSPHSLFLLHPSRVVDKDDAGREGRGKVLTLEHQSLLLLPSLRLTQPKFVEKTPRGGKQEERFQCLHP